MVKLSDILAVIREERHLTFMSLFGIIMALTVYLAGYFIIISRIPKHLSTYYIQNYNLFAIPISFIFFLPTLIMWLKMLLRALKEVTIIEQENIARTIAKIIEMGRRLE